MKRLFIAAAAACLIAVPASPAGAAVALTAPGGFVAGFVPPVVVVAEGEGITYANADVAPHNLIADGVFRSKKAAKKTKWCSAYDKGRCPLFWSETITAGQTTEVLGLEVLEAGAQYPFFCSVHPGMKGTLIVR